MWNRVALLCSFLLMAQIVAAEESSESIVGRWNLKVKGADGEFPSWLEIRKSGYATLVGSFVGQFGSARPISKIEKTNNGFAFRIPPQWEQTSTDLTFNFQLKDGVLVGETTGLGETAASWTAQAAPSLNRRSREIAWGDEIALFNGKNLDGWTKQLRGVPNGWKVVDGLLTNAEPGNNLVSDKKFSDLRLRAEFHYPEGSNSGLYLRGRYEVQIEDSHGKPAEKHKMGAVYGFLTPSFNAAKPAGEWQTYEIELVGRHVTIVLNGETIIDRQEIPGITGGALDSDEASDGPILIQGDHGPIEFRKLTIAQPVRS